MTLQFIFRDCRKVIISLENAMKIFSRILKNPQKVKIKDPLFVVHVVSLQKILEVCL